MRAIWLAVALMALGSCAMRDEISHDFTQSSYLVFLAPPESAGATVALNIDGAEPSTSMIFWHSMPGQNGVRWQLFNLPAGDYVLRSVSIMRENIWSICFKTTTYAFTVGDNEIAYGGQIDLATTVSELNAQLKTQWRPATPGVVMRVTDSASAPRVTLAPPSAEELERVRAEVMYAPPWSERPIRWAEPREVAANVSYCF